MWSVVYVDAIDCTIGQTFVYGPDILGLAQRRVHLVDRVIGGGQLLGEEQVMRRNLGCDIYALCLASAHEVNRIRCRQVTHVQA